MLRNIQNRYNVNRSFSVKRSDKESKKRQNNSDQSDKKESSSENSDNKEQKDNIIIDPLTNYSHVKYSQNNINNMGVIFQDKVVSSFLNDIEFLIDSRTLNLKKIYDVLELLKLAIKKTEDVDTLVKVCELHQKISRYYDFDLKNNQMIFDNIKLFLSISFSKNVFAKKSESLALLQRKVLLLLEFYLMKDKDLLTLSQIEYLVQFITDLLDSGLNYPVVPFVFIFLKLFEIVQSSFTDNLNSKIRTIFENAKDCLSEHIPQTTEGINLIKLVQAKHF